MGSTVICVVLFVCVALFVCVVLFICVVPFVCIVLFVCVVLFVLYCLCHCVVLFFFFYYVCHTNVRESWFNIHMVRLPPTGGFYTYTSFCPCHMLSDMYAINIARSGTLETSEFPDLVILQISQSYT
jgi:hypothetical protein